MIDKAWVPCVLEDVTIDASFYVGGINYTASTDQDFQALFLLPRGTSKDGLRLFVDGLKIGIYEASPSDFIARVMVYASNYEGAETLLDDSTPRNAKGSYSYSIPEFDTSRFEKVIVRIWCNTSQPRGLDISSILLSCYYH
jgi:hypothetical protein